jgi:Arc/MetJ-type ribon-helix-helix transcriptional regulator
MGLKDLVRKPANQDAPVQDSDAAAQEFISGAAVKSSTSVAPAGRRRGRPPKKVSELRNTTPTMFSLDKKVNRAIDRLTLTPRNLKVSRSDIVRAGVLALQEMEPDLLQALLERVSRNKVIGDDDD